MSPTDCMHIFSEEVAKLTRRLEARQKVARDGDFDIEVRSISETTAILSRAEVAVLARACQAGPKCDFGQIVSDEIAKLIHQIYVRQHIAREHSFDVEVRSLSEVRAALSQVETAALSRILAP